METRILDIPFEPDIAPFLTRLGLDDDRDVAADFAAVLEKAVRLAQPKAAFAAIAVEAADTASGRVAIGGVEFSSRLLAKKLAGAETVWPHVATCGRELYDSALAVENPLERYWWDEIMNQALKDIRAALETHIEDAFQSGPTTIMGPGSLDAWPLEQQIPLFRLLGDAPARVGVELTADLIMLPFKSVSGILFSNAEGWECCSLCRQEGCPNRRAAYDAAEAMANECQDSI